MTIKPSDLDQFTGTSEWFRHALVKTVTYTEGVQFFAEKVGGYWLLDIIATELRGHEFLHIKMVVTGSKAVITADDGNDNVVWTRHIDFTDCPEGEWRFYFTDNVIMVPSEY